MASTIVYRTARPKQQVFFHILRNSSSSSSTQAGTRWKRLALQLSGGLLTTGALGYAWAYSQAVHASGNKAHLVSLPWSFRGPFDSLDHASVRRGFEVYKQVCAACHSMKFLAYRHLIGATHTEEEVKTLAAQDQITDGPDDQGNMFQRPGKITDYMPSPYANDKVSIDRPMKRPDLIPIHSRQRRQPMAVLCHLIFPSLPSVSHLHPQFADQSRV